MKYTDTPSVFTETNAPNINFIALDEINGIGPKSKDLLLRKFKSVKRIREATFEELKEIIGESKAKSIINYWSDQTETR